MQKAIRMLRLPAVRDKVGVCTSQIYQMMAEGTFPQSRLITGRTIGWLEHEIDEWLLARPLMGLVVNKADVSPAVSSSDTNAATTE